jgi:C-terminal processing protease CtpA/Prc
MTLKNWVPSVMVIPEILHAKNITADSDRAQFVFADRNGRELILDLAPLESEDPLDWIDASAGVKQPLYLQRPEDNYWHQYLEDSKIIFVQYNRVQDAPGESIEEFFARISQRMREMPIKSIVLDVRFNSGGNNYLNAPVVEWVKSSMQGFKGSFYIIIGRGTFSAAQTLVTRLEATTDVILVGEPTGGSPNHFGDSVKLQLPHSDLTLAVSSLYHNDAPGDNRTTIEPQLLAQLSSMDYFSGRDPALEAILSAQ